MVAVGLADEAPAVGQHGDHARLAAVDDVREATDAPVAVADERDRAPRDYARAFQAAGLVIEVLREPPFLAENAERKPAEQRWRRIPSFLMLRALKPAGAIARSA